MPEVLKGIGKSVLKYGNVCFLEIGGESKMDKGFLKTIELFNKEKYIFRKQPYNFYGQCNPEEKELHQLYIHYQIFQWTKWLVFATWGLAIATVLLVIFR